jgi:thiosulfate reductase/polysulfide reductase chain A
MCSTNCGILVHVQGGKIVRITGNPDDPVGQGRLCARGQAGLQMTYDPDRLRQPLKRDASGRLTPISWEQAFAEIGQKLQTIRRTAGPQSLVFLSHSAHPYAGWETRFMDAYGSPNWTSHAPTCFAARNVGWQTTIGSVPAGDYRNTRYYISFGRGIIDGISNPQVQALMQAHYDGAHLVMFDPRMSDFASVADEWQPVRPGTDLAVVLAMMNVIIGQGLYASSVPSDTVGFDQLAEAMKPYTPAWAAEKSGVSAATITRLAQELAAAAPAAFVEPGWHGPQGGMYWNSVALTRATACLNALLGNLGKPGGLKLAGPPALPADADLELLKPAPTPSTLPRFDGAGGPEWPLAKGLGRAQVIPQVIESGRPYPIKGVVVSRTNPVRSYPNGDAIVRAFSKLDLVVVIDYQMSDTAWTTAHYVLPESTYLERFDPVLVSGGKKLVLPQPAIAPLHDTRSGDEIIRGLAQATGLGSYFRYTLEQYNDALLAPLGLTTADLREHEVEIPASALKAGTIATPSGKIELASSAMVGAGGPAVPVWEPPLVQAHGSSLHLITGHVPMHTNTTTANVAYLNALMSENQLWIHPRAARARGISEGDVVEVRSEVARQRLRAHLTEGIMPEAVWMAHGFGNVSRQQRLAYGKGASDAALAPIRSAPYSGAAAAAEVLVTVRKVV